MYYEKGVKLVYLPPYSPDLMPIEEAFATLKRWMQQHRQLSTEFKDMADFIMLAVEAFDGMPLKHFQSCYIDD